MDLRDRGGEVVLRLHGIALRGVEMTPDRFERALAGSVRILVAIEPNHPGPLGEKPVGTAIGDALCQEGFVPAPGDERGREEAGAASADGDEERAARDGHGRTGLDRREVSAEWPGRPRIVSLCLPRRRPFLVVVITRRDFLGSSLGALALVWARGPGVMTRLPLGFSTLGCPQWDWVRILDFAAGQ